MLRDITLDWCHNYMSKFLNCTFLELTHAFCKLHQKTLKQIYMEIKEHETRGDWEGGGLLWVDGKVSSWFTSTNYR
jgi:hypothetical protein